MEKSSMQAVRRHHKIRMRRRKAALLKQNQNPGLAKKEGFLKDRKLPFQILKEENWRRYALLAWGLNFIQGKRSITSD